MKETSQDLLTQLSLILSEFDDEMFAKNLSVLMDNSIGKHVRHILDLFECLIQGSVSGCINYDHRNRDLVLESSVSTALERIQFIQSEIQELDLEKSVQMNQKLANIEIELESIIQRELLYNIEHTVHHLAIIRIGIEQNFPEISIPKNFGIAYSTIQHFEQQS
jgi:FtsZ-binding cell division protein ZapB